MSHHKQPAARPEARFCPGCGQPKSHPRAQYCDTCAFDYDERNHEIVMVAAPRWAWSIIFSALEAIASDPDALDEETNREISSALPELVTEDYRPGDDGDAETCSNSVN